MIDVDRAWSNFGDVVRGDRVVIVQTVFQAGVHLWSVREDDDHHPQMEQDLKPPHVNKMCIFEERKGAGLACTRTMYRITMSRAAGNLRRKIPICMLRASSPCTAVPTVA